MSEKKYIKMGEMVLTSNPSEFAILGLGSCIGLVVYDESHKHFFLAHTALPRYEDYRNREQVQSSKMPARFTDKTVQLAVEKFKTLGIPPGKLRAKAVGGCQIFENDLIRIGEKNTKALKEELRRFGIPLVSEYMGGKFGVSMYAIEPNGKIKLRSNGENFEI